MTTPAVPSKHTIVEQVNRLNWVHTIDLGNGLVTRGKWGPPHPLILEALSHIDFRGKKVLDIGCWDGLWSFEAEKRGAAEVFATDYSSQRSFKEDATFRLAQQILGSRASYHPNVSVFDVKQLGVRDFDVVLFCGVYYHLKNPLLAITRLREVMKEGALLVIEGQVITNSAEVFARFHYRDWHSGDPSNWWVPTIPCLREWVECSFFDIVKEVSTPTPPAERQTLIAHLFSRFRLRPAPPEAYGRHLIIARAACRKDPNYVFPDDDLAYCDRNEYWTENRLHGPQPGGAG